MPQFHVVMAIGATQEACFHALQDDLENAVLEALQHGRALPQLVAVDRRQSPPPRTAKVALRARRWLFGVYVLLLCALALSDPSVHRGGALFLLTLKIILLVRDLDLGSEPETTNEPRDASAEEHGRRP